jgi:hypothetical protein
VSIPCWSKECCIAWFVTVRLAFMFGMWSRCQSLVASLTTKTSWMPILSKGWLPFSEVNGFFALWAIWHVVIVVFPSCWVYTSQVVGHWISCLSFDTG